MAHRVAAAEHRAIPAFLDGLRAHLWERLRRAASDLHLAAAQVGVGWRRRGERVGDERLADDAVAGAVGLVKRGGACEEGERKESDGGGEEAHCGVSVGVRDELGEDEVE